MARLRHSKVEFDVAVHAFQVLRKFGAEADAESHFEWLKFSFDQWRSNPHLLEHEARASIPNRVHRMLSQATQEQLPALLDRVLNVLIEDYRRLPLESVTQAVRTVCEFSADDHVRGRAHAIEIVARWNALEADPKDPAFNQAAWRGLECCISTCVMHRDDDFCKVFDVRRRFLTGEAVDLSLASVRTLSALYHDAIAWKMLPSLRTAVDASRSSDDKAILCVTSKLIRLHQMLQADASIEWNTLADAVHVGANSWLCLKDDSPDQVSTLLMLSLGVLQLWQVSTLAVHKHEFSAAGTIAQRCLMLTEMLCTKLLSTTSSAFCACPLLISLARDRCSILHQLICSTLLMCSSCSLELAWLAADCQSKRAASALTLQQLSRAECGDITPEDKSRQYQSLKYALEMCARMFHHQLVDEQILSLERLGAARGLEQAAALAALFRNFTLSFKCLQQSLNVALHSETVLWPFMARICAEWLMLIPLDQSFEAAQWLIQQLSHLEPAKHWSPESARILVAQIWNSATNYEHAQVAIAVHELLIRGETPVLTEMLATIRRFENANTSSSTQIVA